MIKHENAGTEVRTRGTLTISYFTLDFGCRKIGLSLGWKSSADGGKGKMVKYAAVFQYRRSVCAGRALYGVD